MKRLTWFILRSFVGPFLISFGIAMFFLVMQFLWKYVDDLMGKGLEFSLMAELLFYVSATLIPLALPLAVLFSSIMTFGNLAENNELTALKSSGLSLFRIMRPMLVFVFILSAGAFYFTNYVLPVASLKFTAIIWNIQEKKPTFALTEGVFYNQIDGYSIRVDAKDDNTGLIEGVLIYDNSIIDGKTIRAKRGEMLKTVNNRYLLLRLEDGVMYQQISPSQGAQSRHPFQKSFFKEAIMKFDMSAFQMPEENQDLFMRDYEMMNFLQLQRALDSLYLLEDSISVEFVTSVENRLLILDRRYISKEGLLQPSTDTTLNQGVAFQPVDTLILLKNLHGSERAQAEALAQTSIRVAKDNIYSQSLYVAAREANFIAYKASWHKKFTLSFAVIILFFIGAPLGAIVRKGGLGAPLVLATLFFLLYYILTITGENMVETAYISPWAGSWLSSIVLTPLGIWLTWKAANDSVLFDREAYKRRLAKLIRQKTNESSSDLQ